MGWTEAEKNKHNGLTPPCNRIYDASTFDASAAPDPSSTVGHVSFPGL